MIWTYWDRKSSSRKQEVTRIVNYDQNKAIHQKTSQQVQAPEIPEKQNNRVNNMQMQLVYEVKVIVGHEGSTLQTSTNSSSTLSKLRSNTYY